MKSLVLVALVLHGVAARRRGAVAADPKNKPKIGSCLELESADKEYLKGYQIVGVTDPEAPSRLAVDPQSNELVGPRYRSAAVWWVKKGGDARTKTGRLPFKVRLLRYSPAGVLRTLHAQGKVELYKEESGSGGEPVVCVKLARPKPWWKIRLL